MRELLELDDYSEMLDAVLQHSLTILDADRGFLVLEHGDARDAAFLQVLETVAQVAQAELPLLVQGPSGCDRRSSATGWPESTSTLRTPRQGAGPWYG